MINILNFQVLFFFCSQKEFVIRHVIHKTLVRIANSKDSEQTAASV